jgi:hypothetical protein
MDLHGLLQGANCYFKKIMLKYVFYLGQLILQVYKMELDSLGPFLRTDTNFGRD